MEKVLPKTEVLGVRIPKLEKPGETSITKKRHPNWAFEKNVGQRNQKARESLNQGISQTSERDGGGDYQKGNESPCKRRSIYFYHKDAEG